MAFINPGKQTGSFWNRTSDLLFSMVLQSTKLATEARQQHRSLETASFPFPKRQILDASKLKEYADDNFKFDENGRKFYNWVENTMGKGEIARYEQFLLFPQCFQKTFTADM